MVDEKQVTCVFTRPACVKHSTEAPQGSATRCEFKLHRFCVNSQTALKVYI